MQRKLATCEWFKPGCCWTQHTHAFRAGAAEGGLDLTQVQREMAICHQIRNKDIPTRYVKLVFQIAGKHNLYHNLESNLGANAMHPNTYISGIDTSTQEYRPYFQRFDGNLNTSPQSMQASLSNGYLNYFKFSMRKNSAASSGRVVSPNQYPENDSFKQEAYKANQDGQSVASSLSSNSKVYQGEFGTRLVPGTPMPCSSHPNGHGPTNTINRAELAGILAALQQGHTAIASDSASYLSQISKQTFNPMRMRTHLHAELIRAISNVFEYSPHPIHLYKVKAHSDIIVQVLAKFPAGSIKFQTPQH
eukprot:1137924-Pelagomonas_calceolata.AAC.1